MFTPSKIFSTFSVDDIGKAKAFYQTVLGLPVKESPEGLSITVSNDYSLFLYPKPNHLPATYTVLNFQVDNIDEAVDLLAKEGVNFLQYQGDLQTDKKGIARHLPHGPLMAWFTDPAGNILGVMQSRQN
jgi:predicted enzyme related to lactoylglutathione lyase